MHLNIMCRNSGKGISPFKSRRCHQDRQDRQKLLGSIENVRFLKLTLISYDKSIVNYFCTCSYLLARNRDFLISHLYLLPYSVGISSLR